MSTKANSSGISTLENPNVYEYIDFSGLMDAYRRSTGCPLVAIDGDIIQSSENEDVFAIARPTPGEAMKLLLEDESVSMEEFGDDVDED